MSSLKTLVYIAPKQKGLEDVIKKQAHTNVAVTQSKEGYFIEFATGLSEEEALDFKRRVENTHKVGVFDFMCFP